MTNLQSILNKQNTLSDNKFFKLLGVSPFGVAVFIILALSPLFIEDQYVMHLLISSLMFGALAIGFDFTVGFINIVNFGYAAFMGVGAYTSALLVSRLDLSPALAMLAGSILAAVLGFLIGLLTLRLRGMFAAIMAWFFGITLMSLAANMVDLTRGHLGLNVPILFPGAGRDAYFYLILGITAVTYIVLRKIINSHIGLAFRAIGQNIEAARSSGVDSTKYRVFNFTVSCFFAGLIGGFYAFFVGVLTPAVMHTRVTVEILVLCYIGGRGSLWGGLLAAFLVIPIFEYLRPLMEIRLIIYGLLMILVMIYYPGGLAAVYAQLVDLIRDMLGIKSKSVTG